MDVVSTGLAVNVIRPEPEAMPSPEQAQWWGTNPKREGTKTYRIIEIKIVSFCGKICAILEIPNFY